MPASVRLVRMTLEQAEDYLERDVQLFVREDVAAGYWSAEEALVKARNAHTSLLPLGPDTEGHHFFTIVDAGSGEAVGSTWLHEDHSLNPPIGYIFDIVIEEPLRRQGYGEGTMLALEALATDLGLGYLGLHVFAHNPGARQLYEKLGYTVRSLNMTKTLDRGRGAERG